MKFNPIGSVFLNDASELPKVMLKVVASPQNFPLCRGCFYANPKHRTCREHACTPYLRKDKKHVIFIKYE